MSPEYSVTLTLKAVEVSASSPAEAIAKVSEQIVGSLNANVEAATATKLDRITVTGPGWREPP